MSIMSEHAALRRGLLIVCAVAAVMASLDGVAVAAAPRAVFALEALHTSGRATYFILQSRPGATIRRAVRVVNTGERAGTVRLYPVDATTGQTTGAVYRDRHDPRRDVGGWMTPAATRLRLAPRQSATVALTITVPRQVRDGQHLGGVVAENAELAQGPTRRRGRGSFRVDVRSLTIVAVQVNLPGGHRERLAVTGVRPGTIAGHQALLVGLRNHGNRLLKGHGRLTVDSADGAPIRRARFRVDTFVPHTNVAYPVAIPGRGLPDGTYIATVTLRYGHGHAARLRAPFVISRKQVAQVFGPGPAQAPPRPAPARLPLLALALGGLLLLTLGFVASLAVARLRAPSPAAAPPRDELPRA
jgi:hypothetical protein